MRQKYVEPDFRPNLKEGVSQCAICRKVVKNSVWRGFMSYDGFFVIHPEDIAFAPTGSWHDVGSNCVKRIGREWFLKNHF